MTPAGHPRVLPRAEHDAIGAAVECAARGDRALYRMLLARLVDTHQVDMANLERAAAARDWAGVQRAVHRMKGSAALARCPTLVKASLSIEGAALLERGKVVSMLLPRYLAIVTDFNEALLALQAAASRPGHIEKN